MSRGHRPSGAKTSDSSAPEPIQQQDDTNQNDGELRPIKRLIADLRCEHPPWKIIALLDGLYADGPVMELLQGFDRLYHGGQAQ